MCATFIFCWMLVLCYNIMLTYVGGAVFPFVQPVVDAFDPRLLVAPATFHMMDFTKIKVLTST